MHFHLNLTHLNQTEMFGEAWSPMSVPDLAPDDDDESDYLQFS